MIDLKKYTESQLVEALEFCLGYKISQRIMSVRPDHQPVLTAMINKLCDEIVNLVAEDIYISAVDRCTEQLEGITQADLTAISEDLIESFQKRGLL